ncbi:MAG: hypothetical protein J0M24_10725 [Verrucomicrobia bacterium]|nr:hypothetical protein [Verrucomicrobiota bacterium]
MTVEFLFLSAPAPTGLPATHDLAVLPQRGDLVTFVDGSRWAVSEIQTDVRESSVAVIIHVGPYLEHRNAR